ncbi:MAG TPA: ABC transporter ATP-binding protein [Solirubrobacteraceae bacterium]|nr:ABC transporter ATP-binding protein [Solirubrobacteraceae bacterium]
MAALLRSSLRGRHRELRGLAGWSLVEALPAFLSGLLVARAIDDGFLAGNVMTGLAWLGALAGSALVGAWATRATFLRLAGIVEPLRDALVVRTVEGSLGRAGATGRGDSESVARLTGQVEIVREAYASVLLVTQGFLVGTVAALLGLLALEPVVLVLVVPPLLAGLALFGAALPGMAARQKASILADERIATAGGVAAEGLRDIAACGAEDRVATTVGEQIDAQAAATRELARFNALRTVAVAIGGLLPIVLILAFGPWLLRNGASTGAIIGALTYVAQGVHPSLQTLIRGLANTGLWLVVTLARIVEATELAPPSSGESADAGPARDGAGPVPAGHELTLRGVTFGYGEGAEPVVRGLDLIVPEGDHLAIVGPSGVGKSTLASLIAGLLAPQEGELRLGGAPVGQLDAATAARTRALIPQEAYVFAGTLRENLAYLDPGAPDARLDETVELLGMRALCDRLGGLDAQIAPAALSGGERQLVTLARAYGAPAPLVILDEATCHLDPATEARVERAFAAREGTLVVIAHRISSAQRARRILVLDAGRAAVGTHGELVRGSRLYRDLVGHWTGTPRLPPQRVRARLRATLLRALGRLTDVDRVRSSRA